MVKWKDLLLQALALNGETLADIFAANMDQEEMDNPNTDEDIVAWSTRYVYIGVLLEGASPTVVSAQISPEFIRNVKFW